MREPEANAPAPGVVSGCRPQCGACCIAPSIHQPFFGMPGGKPAGISCVHLSEKMSCTIFDDPRRPDVCSQFLAEPSICGNDRVEALRILQTLEVMSRPDNISSERLV